MLAHRSSRGAVHRLILSVAALIVGGAVFSYSTSCGCGRGVDEHQVFTAHQFVTAASPTLQLGEDATVTGASGCLSGVVAHYKADPGTGWACSVPCPNGAADCPLTWSCAWLVPGSRAAGTSLCIPGPSWQPAPTTPRGAVAPPRPVSTTSYPYSPSATPIDGGTP